MILELLIAKIGQQILPRLLDHKLLSAGLLISLVGFFAPWMAYGDIAWITVSGADASPAWSVSFAAIICASAIPMFLPYSLQHRRNAVLVLLGAIINLAITGYLVINLSDLIDGGIGQWLYGIWVTVSGLALWIAGALWAIVRLP